MSAMKHSNREQLFALAVSLLEGREQTRVRLHVDECDVCRAIYESYLKVDSALDAWKPVGPSSLFDARVRAAVRAVEPARRPRTFFGLEWVRVLSPALAAMLVVVAGTVIIRARRHAVSPNPTRVAAAVQNNAAAGKSGQTADQELKMYENLSVLEDYDMLANIEGIAEPPKGNEARVAD